LRLSLAFFENNWLESRKDSQKTLSLSLASSKVKQSKTLDDASDETIHLLNVGNNQCLTLELLDVSLFGSWVRSSALQPSVYYLFSFMDLMLV